jgi:glutamate/aspartate transport system substrate-binding protein
VETLWNSNHSQTWGKFLPHDDEPLFRFSFSQPKVNTMKKHLLPLAFLASSLYVGSAFAQSTLDKVNASGSVTIGVRESSGALSYSLGDGRYAGMHVEVCQRIVSEIEKKLGKKIEVKLQQVTAPTRISLLQNGTIDMECGNTTNNATRQKDVSFLNTTYVEEIRMAVRANSGLTSIAQLGGKTVVATAGSTTVQTLRRNERALGLDFKEIFGKDNSDSFLLLESGRAEAFVYDSSVLASNIAISKNPADFKIVGEVLNTEPIAIMIRKDDAALKALGNEVIAGIVKSGEMAKLYDKWFVQAIPPKNIRLNLPASDATKSAWQSPNDRPMEDYNKKP